MRKKFLIFFLSVLVINCLASDTEANGLKILEVSSDLSSVDVKTDSLESDSDLCSQKCSKQFEELKKNLTELHSLYVSLHSQLEHMSRHVIFHENALKHIANWGHKPNKSHHLNGDNQQNTSSDDSHNKSEESDEETKIHFHQNSGQKHDPTTHNKHHHHLRHNHHNKQSHNKPNNQCKCGQKPCPECGPEPPPCNQCSPEHQIEENVGQDASKTGAVDDLTPGKLNSNPNGLSDPVIKINETNSLNDSQTTNRSEKVIFPKNSVEERIYFQTMQQEFHNWFTNMLSQHRNDRSGNGLKNGRISDQSVIADEMEKPEDLIFATCAVKPNRHITLLNQQDVEGTIDLWQLKDNMGPLHMHIKLKGFKHTDERTHSEHLNHQNSNVRQKRESNIIAVEVSPDENVQPFGASHSHGFHVHEFGDLSRDCQSTGSHYNPFNRTHGGLYDIERHVGDLGSIRCDKNGEIDAEYTYSQVSLSGEHSILNRSLVIHALVDDNGRNPQSTYSKTTGSTGSRIACCIIEHVKQLPKEADTQSKVSGSSVDTSMVQMLKKNSRNPTQPKSAISKEQELEMSDLLEAINRYEQQKAIRNKSNR